MAQQLPGMLLAVEDITPYRQAVEALQLKEYYINLLFSIIDDLTVWSATDIDEIVTYSLEKVGLVSSADRVYLCLFHDHKTRLSITHEMAQRSHRISGARTDGGQGGNLCRTAWAG